MGTRFWERRFEVGGRRFLKRHSRRIASTCCTAMLACCLNSDAPADQDPSWLRQGWISIDDPIGSAQTVQVTETFYRDAPDLFDNSAPYPRPLLPMETVTLQLQAPPPATPDAWRYRAHWKYRHPAGPDNYCVVNGGSQAMSPENQPPPPFVMFCDFEPPLWRMAADGIREHISAFRQSPSDTAVSTVLAFRDGRLVLMTSQKSSRDFVSLHVLNPDVTETWFDPETHLPIRESMFMRGEEGKLTEIRRIEYSDWVLNRPLPPSLFDTSPSAVKANGQGR